MLKIKNITVQDKEYECGNINLILGGNNTGKSTFIKELLSGMQNVETKQNKFWIKKFKINVSNISDDFEKLFPNILDLNDFELVGDFNKKGIGVIYSVEHWNRHVYNEIRKIGNSNINKEINESSLIGEELHFYKFICHLKTLREGCEDRLSPQLSTNVVKLNSPYENLVHYLYANPSLFKNISRHIKKTFKIEIVFDDIIQGQKDIRIKPSIISPVSKKTNPVKYSEFWEKNSELLNVQGDGIKAYLKICFSLFNLSKDVIFIDEPETFLHPPQRRSLGKFISENANKGKQLFIATHDSEILRGILLLESKTTKIFYLKRYEENRECHYLDTKNLSDKSRQYNEYVLNGFFNKLTVLCEAEDDRNIYQYAAQKYLSVESVDIQFVGLNGKSEVINNLVLLRKLGINVCCIFDIDALYSSEILHKELQLSPEIRKKIKLFQNNLKGLLKMDQTDIVGKKLSTKLKNEFKKEGINHQSLLLIKDDMLSCMNELKKVGIFIIEVGHLESWFDFRKKDDKKLQRAINIINTKRNTKLKDFLKETISSKYE